MDLYKVLEIPANADLETIKKSYKKLALKYHPDRNINNVQEANERFKEINEAYGVLSDPVRRERYDKFGHQGLQILNQQASPNENIQQQKGPDIRHEIHVSLKDMYMGTVRKIKVNRNITCKDCCGFGRKNKNQYNGPMDCSECQGRGKMQRNVNVGGFFQIQQVVACNHCEGSGIPASAKCGTCSGLKIVKGDTIIDFQIEKGSRPGTEIKFEKMGDEFPINPGEPQIIPGDIIVILRDNKDGILFERHPHDVDNLIYRKTISLRDVLTGYSFVIEHMDGRKLQISGTDIIQPDTVKQVKGEGMRKTGDLFIVFTMEFPKELSVESKKMIRSLLPA